MVGGVGMSCNHDVTSAAGGKLPKAAYWGCGKEKFVGMLGAAVENADLSLAEMEDLFFGQLQEIFFVCPVQVLCCAGIHDSFFGLGGLFK